MNINKLMRPRGAWGAPPDLVAPICLVDTSASEQCAQSTQNDIPLWR